MLFENTTTKNIQQKFSRFEMKYIIRKSISESIQKEIRNFMIYDGYANKELKKNYIILNKVNAKGDCPGSIKNL